VTRGSREALQNLSELPCAKSGPPIGAASKGTNLTADKVDGVDMPLSGGTNVDPANVAAYSCV
jgi:hypothetical protein